MKKYNFNAGPSILPQQVIKATIDACTDFENTGLSLMEISHRSKEFQPVMDNAEALMKEILDIPEGYRAHSSAWCLSTSWKRKPLISTPAHGQRKP